MRTSTTAGRIPARPPRGRLRLLAAGALALALAPATAVAQQPMGLEEALGRARDRNERVLAARAAAGRAEAERGVAWGRALPEVGLTGRATRIDEPIVADLDAVRQVMLQLNPQVPAQLVPPFRSQIQGERFDNLSVSATWPLFTGGRVRAGIRAADAAVDAARAQEAAVAGEVSLEVVQRYFGVRLATEALAVREATTASLERHARRARDLEAQGQIARAERLRAEVSLAEAERELRTARRDAQLAQLALASTLSAEGAVTPTTALPDVGEVEPVERFRRLAAEHNPALGRLRAERTRVRHGVAATRGEFAPTVALFGTRELYTQDLTLLQPRQAVGVAVSVPLFQGGQRWGRLAAARQLEREVELRESRARRDVEMLVEMRYRELEEARDRLASLATTRELAEESLRAQQVAFAAGLATSLDVVDAELALSRLRLGTLKAQHDAGLALAGLLEAAGQVDRLPDYMHAHETGGAGR